VASAEALCDPELRIQAHFGAALRDEIIAWHSSFTGPHLKNSVPNHQLVPKIDDNIDAVMLRLRKNAVSNSNAVDELIKRATASQRLCYMPPTWQPWM
jgi:hypothetical protein